MGFVATREEEQGRGIGRALTAHGLADDYATDYTFCFTDWRATNLLASRMWLGQGWKPVAYRLTRRLEPHQRLARSLTAEEIRLKGSVQHIVGTMKN